MSDAVPPLEAYFNLIYYGQPTAPERDTPRELPPAVRVLNHE
ncbi:hypothetical protein [Natrarchaeobaculum sulfurireducens]|nr:hypothetical protein [Natrarchaeobaculum sulfurireducens]